MQGGKDIKHGSSVPGRSFQSLPEDRTISIALSNEHNLENQGQEMGFKKESSGKLGTHQMMTESQPPAISETIVESAADRIPKNRPSLLLDGIVGSFTNALLSSSIVPAEKSVWRKSALVAEAARASIVDPSLLGPKQCSAIVVNYISAGYILLPFAFYQAGYVYSAVVFGMVALQSYVTSLFILETCARAGAIAWSTSADDLPPEDFIAIRDTKYELSYLQHTFLGPQWTKFFLCTTACDLYGITWLVCSIFGQALAEQFPVAEVSDNYKLWVGVFILITVPLSCTSVLDQALLQFIFLAGRMLMVLFMMGTVIVAFVDGDRAYFGDQLGPVNDAPPINFTHTITIIQTAIFATSFQFSVPGMASISSNKKSMTRIFSNAVTFVYVSNITLAILMALYFGSATNPSSNLNWSDYHSHNSGWSTFVSGYIVLFAAVDGLAVFPLMCCSLGDILLAGFFGDEAPLAEKNVKTRIFFRLLASVPQSIGALFVDDLAILAKYGGVFTIVSYIAAPAVLYITSGRAMREKDLPTTTVYSSKWFSKEWLAYSMLVTTFLVVVGVVLDSILRDN